MKRCLTLLLAIVTFLLPCGITVNAEGELSENSKNMITFIKDKNNSLLIVRTNYAYMQLGAKWHWDVGVNYCLQMADLLIDTGSSPDKEKYMEVLINIIATYDMDNAADLSSQKKQDNLKSIKDYAMDIVKMGGDAVSVYTKLKGIKGELSNFEDILSKAVDGVGVLADNTNNWLDALTNLETFIQDFSNYNSFLKYIEENSDGELKDAAYTLRNSLKKSFLLKLETYGKVSSENFDNYTFFFFDDVFFDAAKMISDYETDDAYKFIINSSEGAWERIFILKGSWDLGKDIGKLVGNIVVGGEDLINRTLEIEALYDISVILQDKVFDATNDFLTHSTDSDADNYIDEYITYANFLIGCRIRGEYCTYTILAEDSGLLSLLSDKTDAQDWYNEQSSAIIRLKNQINYIKTASNEKESSINIDVTAEDWKLIYKAKLQEKAKEYNGSEYDAKFELVDIDQNGIPELFISQGTYRISVCEVYTINDGEIKQLSVASMYGMLNYNSKEKLLGDVHVYAGSSVLYWVGKLANGEIEEVYSSQSHDDTFIVNGEEVTLEEYNEANSKYPIQGGSDWTGVGRKYSLNSKEIDAILGTSYDQKTELSNTDNKKSNWDDYVSLLNEFVSSGKWAKLSETEIQNTNSLFSSEFINYNDIRNPDEWSITDGNKHIFDMDDDGIPEMILKIESSVYKVGSTGPASNTEFVAIKDGKATILMNAYWTGGSMQGDSIGICKNITDNKYYVAYYSHEHIDAGNNNSSITYYDYLSGNVKETHYIGKNVSYDWSSRNSEPTIACTIDGRDVSETEYNNLSNSFSSVANEDLPK